MKRFLLFWVLLLSGIALAQKKYEIKGEISGASETGKLYLQYFSADGSWKSQEVAVTNNRFSFEGQTDEPLLIYVYNNPDFDSDGKSMTQLYAEPGTMTVSADYKDLSKIVVTGSKTQDDLVALHRFKSAINRKQDSVSSERKKAIARLQSAKNEDQKKILQKDVDRAYTIFDSLWVAEIKSELEFFTEHRNSFAAIRPLTMRIGQGTGVPFRDQITSVAKNLSEEVRNSRAGKQLMQRVAVYERSKVGSKAQGFSLTDIGNKKISLSEFVGRKYVLLDFWASYCAPCRAEYPELKQVLANYPKLEVVNISKDQNLESWKKAIAKDGIASWSHVSALANNETKIFDDYNVTFIPVKVLIDPNGVIVARWDGSGTDKLSDLKDELKQIFE